MKKVLALVLAVFIFGGSTLAFAWWDQLETTDENVTVTVGEGVTISVNLDTQTNGVLVPNGVVMKTDDVTEVLVNFTVTLDSTSLVDPLDLDAAVSNIKVGGVDTYAGLVSATVTTNPGTIHNAPVEIVITVSLNMPADQTAYDAVANQPITFDVTFTATQQQ